MIQIFLIFSIKLSNLRKFNQHVSRNGVLSRMEGVWDRMFDIHINIKLLINLLPIHEIMWWKIGSRWNWHYKVRDWKIVARVICICCYIYVMIPRRVWYTQGSVAVLILLHDSLMSVRIDFSQVVDFCSDTVTFNVCMWCLRRNINNDIIELGWGRTKVSWLSLGRNWDIHKKKCLW